MRCQQEPLIYTRPETDFIDTRPDYQPWAIGCDPGAHFGIAWSYSRADACPPPSRVYDETSSGWWDLAEIPDPGHRYDLLYGALSRFRPTFIFWETAPGLKGQALRWHLGYMAIGQQWAHNVGARFVGINTFDVKEFATGKRGAKKWEMSAAARKHWGGIPDNPDDNAIDALWILETGLRMELETE